MNKPLFLFVGRSASGKTTIANMLEKAGYPQVKSYTTRKPRYDDEPGHIFVDKEEFDNLGELAAYTLYNGNEYGTTFDQLDKCSIYVVDVPGVETLMQKYAKNNRNICVIYFNASVYTRINRMIDRDDCDSAIVSRLIEDEKFDWLSRLTEAIYPMNNIHIYSVNADMDLDNVFNQVLYYIKCQEDGHDFSN